MPSAEFFHSGRYYDYRLNCTYITQNVFSCMTFRVIFIFHLTNLLVAQIDGYTDNHVIDNFVFSLNIGCIVLLISEMDSLPPKTYILSPKSLLYVI